MPADAVLDLLRRNDPARSLARIDDAARDRLRNAIVGTPVAPARRTTRRLVLAAALVIAALAASGWTIYETVFAGPTAQDVRDDFRTETRGIPLPPGARWRLPDLDHRGVYPGPQARMIALMQSTCAWFGYWEAGGPEQRAAALRAEARIRALMPFHPEGAPEDAGGFDITSFQAYDAIVDAQRRGDAAPTASYLRANCG